MWNASVVDDLTKQMIATLSAEDQAAVRERRARLVIASDDLGRHAAYAVPIVTLTVDDLKRLLLEQVPAAI